MAQRDNSKPSPLRARLAALALTLPLFTAGCWHAPAHPKESADTFLRETLAGYAKLASYRTETTWLASAEGSQFASVRSIDYASPNRYRVETVHDNTLLLVSVSDGVQVTEYSNVPGMIAGIYPAPPTLARADSPQMKNPLDCGSPLYAFFSGTDGYSKLVDTHATPPRYGPGVDLGGMRCITVDFTEPGYGPVSAVIGVEDKRVREIAYNAAASTVSHSTEEPDSAPSSGAPLFKEPLPTKSATLKVVERISDVPVEAKASNDAFNTTLPESLPPFRLAENNPGANTSADSSKPSNLDTPPVPLGSPAPDVSVVDANTGRAVKLSSLRGQVVMMDFFASWCMPCRLSLPETQKIFKTYGGHGLAVMGVDGESRTTIRKFLAQNRYDFPAYADTESTASQAYHVNAIPTIVIVDKAGRLSYYAVGLQEKSAVETAIKKAGV